MGKRRRSRVGPAIGAFLIACVLVACEVLVLLIRGGTCGESEGGGSCSASFIDYALIVPAAVAVLMAALLLIKRR